MKTFKQLMALLLVFVLVAACVPLGTITAFAAENDDTDISTADNEIDAETENSTEPAQTENESEAPPPDESAGTEPEEEHAPAEAVEEDSPPSDPEEEVPEPIPDEEETEPNPENPFLDLANEFDPEVLDFLWELFPDGEIPMDFDLVDFFNSYTTYGGSSGSETGDGGGGGNAAGSGSSNMVAAGVTMQIVYYRYDQCYNRYNSHGSVVGTLQNGKALPWNSTGKDNGSSETTVFDTYTISPHTFIVKAQWNSYPYVYHFPNSGLADDNCKFTWVGFTNYWFNYYNPGGKPETSPYIVRNETNGSLAIEQFLARIILGNSYGAWDKLDVAKGETVATDSSLYASVLKYLGASDLAIQNYLDAYYGKLSISQNGSTLIPTIIWSWVGAENLGGTNRIYTIGDVAANGSSNTSWLKTAYTSGANCNTGFGACSWMKSSTDTMICKLMLGGNHSSNHNSSIWTSNGSSNLFGTGLVNRIQAQVDATTENGTNTFYYLRGYWTPYGTGNGSISLTKTNTSGSKKLAGAEFTLYRDAACTIPVTSSDYETLSSSDIGYVSASVRRTNTSGQANWTGLYTGTYFLKETKVPDGYQVNVDATGNVQVKEVSVGKGTSNVTLTNAENAKPVTLKKTINAPQACIDQIKGNPLYSLAGAEYSVTVNGKVVETLKTDANGNAASSQKYAVGTVLTIKETKAPAGYKLDTKTYTYTVTSGDNVISVSDVPVFDPPFVLTKVDKDTTTPQGDGSFTGAVFKWEFYANNNWSGTATRTWYFATDANGRCIYSKGYLASGYTSSALYVSPAGVNQLPLGTLKITEVKNSLGYTVIQDALYCSIVADSTKASGVKHVWKAESAAILKAMANGDWGVAEPIDTSLFGSVSVDKYDAVTGQTPQGEATLAGAKFQIINSSKNSVVIGGKVIAPGGVCVELTTDAKGHAATGNILPVGTYTIKEVTAPNGYNLNTVWKQTFSITAANQDVNYSYANGTGCPDVVIAGKIQITKKIVNTIDNQSTLEAGAKFSVTDSKGNVVDTIVTGDNGIGTSKDLPYGTYTVKQTSGAAGTILCDPWTVTISENGKVYEYTRENPLWTASVSIHKEEKGLKTPLSATFELCERMANGTVKVLETGITDADGNLTFSRKIVFADGVCNTSSYFVREKEAPAGYVLDTTEYPVSCTQDNQMVSVTVENAPILGSVELRKQSSTGEAMKGVKFLLEYSLDGKTWTPVTKRDSNDTIMPGSCISGSLGADGTLTTDSSGVARFEGLRVFTAEGKAIRYRVTELQTLNGSSLMPDQIWEGTLDDNETFEVVLGVVNSPILELPKTGSQTAKALSILATLFALAGVALLMTRRKKVQ